MSIETSRQRPPAPRMQMHLESGKENLQRGALQDLDRMQKWDAENPTGDGIMPNGKAFTWLRLVDDLGGDKTPVELARFAIEARDGIVERMYLAPIRKDWPANPYDRGWGYGLCWGRLSVHDRIAGTDKRLRPSSAGEYDMGKSIEQTWEKMKEDSPGIQGTRIGKPEYRIGADYVFKFKVRGGGWPIAGSKLAPALLKIRDAECRDVSVPQLKAVVSRLSNT